VKKGQRRSPAQRLQAEWDRRLAAEGHRVIRPSQPSKRQRAIRAYRAR